MQNVFITTNPFDANDYVLHETEDLFALLRYAFPVWPDNARIYAGNIAESCDVTPLDEAGVARLADIKGDIYVVVYPEGGVFDFIVDVISFAFLGVLSFFLPSNKTPDLGNAPSSNNSLGERSNKARPNSRIPDIFGQVRSIPDLLTVPYRVFENNIEVEIAYMCVGRGSYAIDDVRDGDTMLSSIAGAGATFYGPDTSPNSGTLQLQIGSTITQDLYSISKLNEVNGQTLTPPNANTLKKNMRFVSPNVIEGDGSFDFTEKFDDGQTISIYGAQFTQTVAPQIINTTMRFEDGGVIRFDAIDPSDYFEAGSFISLDNATYNALDTTDAFYIYVNLFGYYTVDSVSSTTITLTTPELTNPDWDKLVDYHDSRTDYIYSTVGTSGGATTVNLDGAYTILSVTTNEIILSNPDITNPDWLYLDEFAGMATPFIQISLSTDGVVWVGWFDIDATNMSAIIFNFVAQRGIYGINKDGEQNARTETIAVEMVPISKDGTVLGSVETFSTSMTGSDTEKRQIGETLFCTPATSSRYKARVRRTSPTDLNPKRQAIDEIKWQDCYGAAVVAESDFGDVTTVFSRTYATTSATSLKERRLNALVTRKVALWDGMSFGALTAQTSAAPIICAMALDPKIGNRTVGELNVTQIYSEVATLQTYFGFTESTDFCYTFDTDNISFEETVSTVAGSVFSTAYRVGNIIHIYGEMSRESEPALLLLNHRNKLPKSENRTFTFGIVNDYDGVELTYVDANDDTTKTIYIPDDQSARNPKKIETAGIRNENQAMLQANRAFNKLTFQNTTTKFDALEESEFLINNNRILVADNTRSDTNDGYIISQLGLVLELSQPFVPTDGVDYTIYLQHTDGTVEALDMVAGADQWHVVIDVAPSLPLSLGYEQSVVASYWIVGNNEPRAAAFLMSEKEPSGKNTFSITAINYDIRYYQNDQDFA